jgi:LuxR family maltose regulon positive regulatory protein
VTTAGLLLSAKLHLPTTRPNWVARPQLFARLEAGQAHHLTLISAPAGYGKTTLLSAWAAQSENPVAWLSLDEGDNDLARWLTYWVAAVRQIEPGLAGHSLTRLRSAKPQPLESILTPLLNEIADIPRDFSLILDDYHTITAQPIHEALTFLIDHQPPPLHLVVATRFDPPLPLARWRARDQMREIRMADLRLTSVEAAEFLNRSMNLTLAPEQTAALADHTEGWIAGLQLAALAMRDHTDAAGFIRTFTHSERYILDYLMEEVLQRQSENVQAFLMQTSLLERLNGPLCEAVTGQRNGQAMLEHLEHLNLFLFPFEDDGRWYRYHHLFADLLHQRLDQAQPALGHKLHRRASQWYEHNGYPAEAIRHALAAGDYEHAADQIERVAETTLMHSETTTLLRWMNSLPDALMHTRPLLCVYHAAALILSGHALQAVEAHLQDCRRMDVKATAAGAVAAFHGLIAAYRGDSAQCLALGQRALELLPESNLFLRSLVAGYLALNVLNTGNISAARGALAEAFKVSQQVGNVTNAVLALCHLAEVEVIEGQLHAAEARYAQALALAVDASGRRLPIAGVALLGRGNLLREWNHLDAAQQALVEGLALVKGWAEVGAISGYITLARVQHACHDYAGAQVTLRTAREIAARFDATELDDVAVAAYQARLALQENDLARAVHWVHERGLDERGSDLTSPYHRTLENLTLAWVHLAQAQPEAALRILQPQLEVAEAAGWVAIVIELLSLRALALQQQRRGDEALSTVQRALSLAEAGSFVRIFVDHGPAMAPLLYRAVERRIKPAYASQVLQACATTQAVPHPANSQLVEPLSGREVEVLELIAQGLSNQAIAHQLCLAPSTVKVHCRTIYGKLGVNSRTQAVAKAQALGVLQPVSAG